MANNSRQILISVNSGEGWVFRRVDFLLEVTRLFLWRGVSPDSEGILRHPRHSTCTAPLSEQHRTAHATAAAEHFTLHLLVFCKPCAMSDKPSGVVLRFVLLPLLFVLVAFLTDEHESFVRKLFWSCPSSRFFVFFFTPIAGSSTGCAEIIFRHGSVHTKFHGNYCSHATKDMGIVPACVQANAYQIDPNVSRPIKWKKTLPAFPKPSRLPVRCTSPVSCSTVQPPRVF